MVGTLGYDSTLTRRVKARLSAPSAPPSLPTAPGMAVAASTPPDATGGGPGARDGILHEIAAWSDRLDREHRPSRGFGLAQAAALRAQELSQSLRGRLSASPAVPSGPLGEVEALLGFLSELTRNAVSRVGEFARLLGVTSFSLTLESTPPGISLTLTFSTGAT